MYSGIHVSIVSNFLGTLHLCPLTLRNYKKSEICLNEMGAVWACDTNARYYILPNMRFSEIGWLTSTKQAETITSRTALDALQKEFIEYFGLVDKGLGWSRNRDKFVDTIEQLSE